MSYIRGRPLLGTTQHKGAKIIKKGSKYPPLLGKHGLLNPITPHGFWQVLVLERLSRVDPKLN